MPDIDWGPPCESKHPETGERCHYVPRPHEGSHEGPSGARWSLGPTYDGKAEWWVRDPGGHWRKAASS